MEFSNLGQHCDVHDCRQRDYLPFTCTKCGGVFCLEHHKFADHKCAVGRSQSDVRCEQCPDCGQVIARHRTGSVVESAEEARGRHQRGECGADNKADACVRCKKHAFTNTCLACGSRVCVKHRHADGHSCDKRRRARASRAGAAAVARSKVAPPAAVAVDVDAGANTPARGGGGDDAPLLVPALPAEPSTETVTLRVSLPASTPRTVHVERQWTVSTASRAIAAKFGVSLEEAALMLANASAPLPPDVPLHLIEEELRGATLTLQHSRPVAVSS